MKFDKMLTPDTPGIYFVVCSRERWKKLGKCYPDISHKIFEFKNSLQEVGAIVNWLNDGPCICVVKNSLSAILDSSYDAMETIFDFAHYFKANLVFFMEPADEKQLYEQMPELYALFCLLVRFADDAEGDPRTNVQELILKDEPAFWLSCASYMCERAEEHSKAGRPSSAQYCLEEAAALREEYMPNHPCLADVYASVASILSQSEFQWEKAKEYCEKAISFCEDKMSPIFRAAHIYGRIADAYKNMGDYDRAAMCEKHENQILGINGVSSSACEEFASQENVLFNVESGDTVRFIPKDAVSHDFTVSFQGSNVEITSENIHMDMPISDFAEFIRITEAAGMTVIPLRKSLPEKCYCAQGKKIFIIYKGSNNCHAAESCCTEEEAAEMAKERNAELGVTAIQANAMFGGYTFGWQYPIANPKYYE